MTQRWHITPLMAALVVNGAMASSIAAAQPAQKDLVELLAAWAERPVVAHHATRRLEAQRVGSSDRAWLLVTTLVDRREGLTYRVVAQGGPGMLRKKLVEVLEQERRAYASEEKRRAFITGANYDFAVHDTGASEVEVQLIPKRRDGWLLEGAASLRRDDGDVVRIQGRLVKPPSFWLREVSVVRSYARFGGHVMPTIVESVARVRVLGLYHFTMTYSYQMIDGSPVSQNARRSAVTLAVGERTSGDVAPGEGQP
jgi:hypothetical protein